MAEQLSKVYDSKTVERQVNNLWQSQSYFHAEPSRKGPGRKAFRALRWALARQRHLRHEEIVVGGQVQGMVPEGDVERHFLSRDGAVASRVDADLVCAGHRGQGGEALEEPSEGVVPRQVGHLSRVSTDNSGRTR